MGGRVKSFIETFILIPYIFWILGDQSPEFQDNIFGYLTSFFSFFQSFTIGRREGELLDSDLERESSC
jgi:multisubunit Na+/H+ antiporter MnhE subunit